MFCRAAALWLLAVLGAVAQDAAPVVIDGRELWKVALSRTGFTAAERAADVQESILHVAADGRRDLKDLRELSLETESILLVGRVYLFSVTDDDARQEGKPREVLFAERKKIAVEAIERYRQTRSLGTLIRSILLALLALAAACAALYALRGLRRRAQVLLKRGLARTARAKNLAPVLKALEGPLSLLFQFLVRVAFLAASLIVTAVALSFVLGLFPATASVAALAVSAMFEVLRAAGTAVVAYIPNLFVLLVIGALTYLAIVVCRAMARAVNLGMVTIPGFHRDWAEPTYALVKIVLIMFALVVAFPYLPGGDSPALRGASIFIGVLVSLGSGSAMGNVIAGVILTYMRPFQLGDRVKISDSVGDVVERSLLVTRIRTIKNVELIVPNSAILGAHIVNYSSNARGAGLILSTTVTIGYDVPWQQVAGLLESAARRTTHILAEPKPFVLQTGLNDYHVSYEINAYTHEANRMAVIYSDLHKNIQEEFHGAGVEIMSPSFLALRDGNQAAIPEEQRGPGYVTPAFRVKTAGEAGPAAEPQTP
ncbi:MAG: mechanosensitive ion channel family protein [Acidobacteriota bacterium]